MDGETSLVSQRRPALYWVSWSQLYKDIPVPTAFAIGWTIWGLSPTAPLGENGMHFLATLVAAVILWIFEVFDEYIVALMLLLS